MRDAQEPHIQVGVHTVQTEPVLKASCMLDAVSDGPYGKVCDEAKLCYKAEPKCCCCRPDAHVESSGCFFSSVSATTTPVSKSASVACIMSLVTRNSSL